MEKTSASSCPAEGLLKGLSGKWKPQLFRLAMEGPLRFSRLLKALPQASRQSISVALRELEDQGLLIRTVLREKPLHVEYHLSDAGQSLIPVFLQLESLIQGREAEAE